MVGRERFERCLSSYYKILEQAQGGLTEILTDPQNVNSYISKTQYGDLIYSNDHSNQLQPWLASKGDGRFRLKIAINKLGIKTVVQMRFLMFI
jgi:hypothetical protein